MRKYIFFSLLIIISHQVFGQKYIRDSSIIQFPTNKQFNLFQTDTVIDNRNTDPHVLNITEKNKYIFIPVDFYYCSDTHLSDKLFYLFKDSSNNKKTNIDIYIEHFWISQLNGVSFSQYKLNALFQIYRKQNNNKVHIGNLVYDNYLSKSIFQKTEKKYAELIEQWIKDFSVDLNEIAINKNEEIKPIYNFKPPDFQYQKNLYTGTDISAGLNWWCIDVELLFSEPEATRTFFRTGKLIRYRNDEKYEALEFALISDYLYYRLHKNWLLNMKIMPFIGINRWNDIETEAYGLEEIFLFDLSFSQKIVFNKSDKKCITLGLGLTENVEYIINHDWMLQVGLLIHIGIKL